MKRSFSAFPAVLFLLMVLCLPVTYAGAPDASLPETSPPALSQEKLAEIFTTFSEINTKLEGSMNNAQKIMDDYESGLLTPGTATNSIVKLNEEILETRNNVFTLKCTGKYEEDRVQLIRTYNLLDQSLKDMKIAAGLRNISYYTKARQELQDTIQFKSLIWKQLLDDLQNDGYIPAKPEAK